MSLLTDDQGQSPEPLLDYGCTPWHLSSQRAADLYDSGAKLWTKENLREIEQQLAQSRTRDKFTVRRIDGSLVHIRNPMFGVEKPIWTPYVKFQEYWQLVRARPDGPPETYNCTYLVDWRNQTLSKYRGPFENVQSRFKTSQKRWSESATCKVFTAMLREIVERAGHPRKVNKVVCFGLGDFSTKPPDWRSPGKNSQLEGNRELETSVIEESLIRHAVAVTLAQVARSYADIGGTDLRLVTQDPQYTIETEDILQELGYEIVGAYGAEGFAEVDDTSIVFAPYTSAPVTQIIADLARPAVIICNHSIEILSSFKPYKNAESPRTRQMWKEYIRWDFPIQPKDSYLNLPLNQLFIHARVGDAGEI